MPFLDGTLQGRKKLILEKGEKLSAAERFVCDSGGIL